LSEVILYFIPMYTNALSLLKHTFGHIMLRIAVLLFTIINTEFVKFDYCFVCSKENTFNILIFIKPTKVHDKQCLSTAHSSMICMHNSLVKSN
jgi:hypothetical protein